MQTKELDGMTVAMLLNKAKQLNIVGRHEMTKDVLKAKIKEKLVAEEREELVETEQCRERGIDSDLAKKASLVLWEQRHEDFGDATKGLGAENKKSYLDRIAIGDLVAFKIVLDNKSASQKMLSGKIEEIHSHSFVIATKTGVKFTVSKENIAWVKTTDRWPKGIYLALKGVAGIDEYKRCHTRSIRP